MQPELKPVHCAAHTLQHRVTTSTCCYTDAPELDSFHIVQRKCPLPMASVVTDSACSHHEMY